MIPVGEFQLRLLRVLQTFGCMLNRFSAFFLTDALVTWARMILSSLEVICYFEKSHVSAGFQTPFLQNSNNAAH